MIIKDKNFGMGKMARFGSTIKDGDELIRCMLAQGRPHTKVFVGTKDLKITKCNSLNCDFPSGTIVTKGLNIHKSKCSHRYPSLLAQGQIDECAVDCEHLEKTDTVTIDGALIKEKRHYLKGKVVV